MKPQNIILKVRSFMNSKAMSIFDWLMAIATILWGSYLLFVQHQTDWTTYAILVAGLIGIALAIVKPSKRIESALQKRFIQRS